MNETRLLQLTALLDDARCIASDLLDELPSTSELVLPLKRLMRHSDDDIEILSGHISSGVGPW